MCFGTEVKPRALADGLDMGLRRERMKGVSWAWSHQGNGAILRDAQNREDVGM